MAAPENTEGAVLPLMGNLQGDSLLGQCQFWATPQRAKGRWAVEGPGHPRPWEPSPQPTTGPIPESCTPLLCVYGTDIGGGSRMTTPRRTGLGGCQDSVDCLTMIFCRVLDIWMQFYWILAFLHEKPRMTDGRNLFLGEARQRRRPVVSFSFISDECTRMECLF